LFEKVADVTAVLSTAAAPAAAISTTATTVRREKGGGQYGPFNYDGDNSQSKKSQYETDSFYKVRWQFATLRSGN
jgi:hypothetical protein